jgi:mono/diheme cytochrome c family protein
MARPPLVLAATVLAAANAAAALAAAPARDALAILREECGSCHSDKSKTSGFSVAAAASIVAGGNKYGKAVVEGHPEQSVLIRILKGELQPKMPVGKSLPAADLARVVDWIRQLPPSAAQSASEWRWPFDIPL